MTKHGKLAKKRKEVTENCLTSGSLLRVAENKPVQESRENKEHTFHIRSQIHCNRTGTRLQVTRGKKRMDRWMDRHMDGWVNGWDGWVDRRMDGWVNGWDGWTGVWMDG